MASSTTITNTPKTIQNPALLETPPPPTTVTVNGDNNIVNVQSENQCVLPKSLDFDPQTRQQQRTVAKGNQKVTQDQITANLDRALGEKNVKSNWYPEVTTARDPSTGDLSKTTKYGSSSSAVKEGQELINTYNKDRPDWTPLVADSCNGPKTSGAITDLQKEWKLKDSSGNYTPEFDQELRRRVKANETYNSAHPTANEPATSGLDPESTAFVAGQENPKFNSSILSDPNAQAVTVGVDSKDPSKKGTVFVDPQAQDYMKQYGLKLDPKTGMVGQTNVKPSAENGYSELSVQNDRLMSQEFDAKTGKRTGDARLVQGELPEQDQKLLEQARTKLNGRLSQSSEGEEWNTRYRSALDSINRAELSGKNYEDYEGTKTLAQNILDDSVGWETSDLVSRGVNDPKYQYTPAVAPSVEPKEVANTDAQYQAYKDQLPSAESKLFEVPSGDPAKPGYVAADPATLERLEELKYTFDPSGGALIAPDGTRTDLSSGGLRNLGFNDKGELEIQDPAANDGGRQIYSRSLDATAQTDIANALTYLKSLEANASPQTQADYQMYRDEIQRYSALGTAYGSGSPNSKLTEVQGWIDVLNSGGNPAKPIDYDYDRVG